MQTQNKVHKTQAYNNVKPIPLQYPAAEQLPPPLHRQAASQFLGSQERERGYFKHRHFLNLGQGSTRCYFKQGILLSMGVVIQSYTSNRQSSGLDELVIWKLLSCTMKGCFSQTFITVCLGSMSDGPRPQNQPKAISRIQLHHVIKVYQKYYYIQK